MKLIRIDRHPSRRQLNVFGLIWLVFFGAVGWGVLGHSGSLSAAGAVWAVAVVVPAVGLAVPGLMRLVYLGMAYATLPIGLVVSLVVLAVVYYLVLTPIGLAMRIVGYDAMDRRFDRRAETYWRPRQRDDREGGYFRQF